MAKDFALELPCDAGSVKSLRVRREVWIGFLLALITVGVFSPVVNDDFVNYDDPLYVTENAEVQEGLTGKGVAWALTADRAVNWHPLTWLSHMLDCQLYGLLPAGHHFTSLLFHLASTVLLFGILRRMTGAVWRSALVAALFAWHPTHVESVAWVAERKDVLSTFFWLLTMGAYLRYTQESKVKGPNSKIFYALALLFFALGLLSKPMLVTLPFVLLLLDYWPLRRASAPDHVNPTAGSLWKPLIWEKVPFFILAAISCVITFRVQNSGGAVASLETVPLNLRLTNALVSYLRYAGEIFWPVDLAVFYPLPHAWPVELVAASTVFLVGTTVVVVLKARSRPWLAVGWLWFTGTLVPVIGLVQVGAQSIADRYLYVPSIGLFIIATWGGAELMAGRPHRQWVLGAAGVAVLAACFTLTSGQLKYWRNSQNLFEHAIAVTSDNTPAYVNLGDAFLEQGRIDEGILNLRRALALHPDLINIPRALAVSLDLQGKAREAIPFYRATLRLDPDSVLALNNLAWLLAANADPELRNGEEAVRLAERACELTHYDRAMVVGTLAAAYAEAGRFDEAAATANTACKLAQTKGDQKLIAKNRKLLELYRASKPFHESPPKPKSRRTTLNPAPAGS